MVTLVVRRAWVQRRLLAAVVLLVALATILMGFYALLLGVSGPRAFSEQVQLAQPGEVNVTAYVVGVAAADLGTTRQEARGVVQQILAPVHPSLVSTATSQLRQIGDSGRLAYLATTDARAGRGVLTSGHWPDDTTDGPIEAVAPDAAARTLRLRLGDRLRLGPGSGLGSNQSRATVVLVGTFRGLPRASSQSDPLLGAGFDPTYNNSGVTAPTVGPFLVGPHAFTSTGFDVTGLRVDGHPDLSLADHGSLRAAAASLGSASALLSARVGTSADITSVGSELPSTLARLDTQSATTRSAVLVALLLDTMVGLAALVLAGRLLADTRADERELLTALGLGPGQQVVSALVEALLLAVTAAVVAVPAAALLFSAVTHLPSLRGARLTQGPTVTPALVATVVLGAVALTSVLVVSPLVSWETSRLSARRRAWARSGVDLLLLVLAVAGWWQLRSRQGTVGGSDTVLAVAPVLCLAAATIVVVRSLPPLFALAAAAGSRSRSLLPLSFDPGALRLNAGTALVLLTLASAAATFGVAVHTTWQRSASDQADLRVGTDLALTLDAPPAAVDSARIVHAVTGADPGAGRSPLSPVIARPVALGHFFGAPGRPPELVALDTRHAGALLRGRGADGTSWSEVGGRLTPATPVHGVPLPAGGTGVTLVGRAPTGVAVSVTPTVVLQDAAGFRSTLDAASVPVDGRLHPLHWSDLPPPGQRIVAVHLTFADLGSSGTANDLATVSVVVRVPSHGGHHESWQTQALGLSEAVIHPTISVRRTHGSTLLSTHAILRVSFLQYSEGDVLATAFDPPTAVPVAVSQALVEATGTKLGGQLSATVGDTVILLTVVGIVPNVPSVPGRIAVLGDVDTVSRALIATGHLEPAVDAFWVSHPTAQTAGALDGLKLGEVTTRDAVATDLARGPMQVTLPVAYLTVAASAVVLLLAGATLVVSADRRRKTDGGGPPARHGAVASRRTTARVRAVRRAPHRARPHRRPGRRSGCRGTRPAPGAVRRGHGPRPAGGPRLALGH